MSLTLAVRNTFVQFMGRIFSTIFGVVALAIITRYLGQERYGWYTTVSTFLQFFGILADFGLTLITAQMISEPGADENKIISNIFTLRFWLSVVFFGTAMILIWFFPYPAIIKWGVMVFTLSLFAVTLQNIFVGLFQKHLAMAGVAWGDMLGRGIILVGYAICVWQGLNLLSILFISVVANVLQLGLLWLYARKYIQIKFAYDFSMHKEILQRSWPVAISIAFNLVYLRADTLVLSLVSTQAEVGLYGAAYRIIDVLTSVPTMFMGIMLPMLTYAWVSGGREQFSRYLGRAFDFLSILGWPFLLGGVILSRRVMIFVAGKAFVSSGQYLQILLVALFFIFFGLLASHTILALQKQRQMIIWYLIDAFLSLAGYIILIPVYGAVAAAWVTVFSEGFILFVAGYQVIKTSKVRLNLVIFVKSGLAAALMGLVILQFYSWNFLILMFTAAAVYFFVLFLLKGLTMEMFLSLVKSDR